MNHSHFGKYRLVKRRITLMEAFNLLLELFDTLPVHTQNNEF